MMSNSDANQTTKNPWNQIFMQYDIDGLVQKHEDYKISSSLKTIWNDSSDNEPINSNYNADISRSNNSNGSHTQLNSQMRESPQVCNGVFSVGYGIQLKSAKIVQGSDNAMSTNINPSSLKGRAITARNGGYITNFGNENQQNYNSSVSGSLQQKQQHQNETLELFLQQVQLIVKNGFLDPKILNEPISPETFDLVQMLIYYVMEYKQTRNYANCDHNPALSAEIKNIFYKINLIQNEITKCQLQYVQQKQTQQEILQSFSALDGLLFNQRHFTSQTSNNHFEQQMTTNANGNRIPHTDAVWPNLCVKVENNDQPNQRFYQRQWNRHAQQSNVSSAGKFTFLPKAKNIDQRSQFYEPNRNYSRRDGNFRTN